MLLEEDPSPIHLPWSQRQQTEKQMCIGHIRTQRNLGFPYAPCGCAGTILGQWSCRHYRNKNGRRGLGGTGEGESYSQVITNGYKVNLVANSKVYDYRIPESLDNVLLCE